MHSKKFLAIASMGVLMIAGTAAWDKIPRSTKPPVTRCKIRLRRRALDRERLNMPQGT